MRPAYLALSADGLRAWAVAAALIATSGPALAEWPTAGGDDGAIIRVTTLADSGPGSLRAALATGGRRRIVFEVGGEIVLKQPLVTRSPYATIAGETAPSPGISILGDKLQIRASEIIVRDIRIRVGELPGSNPSARDGISIDLGPNDAPVRNILIDHCSIAWAVDEGIGIWGEGVSNIRIRRTIVAETLRRSIHPKKRHSMGMLVGKGARNIVVEANLFISNEYRNPVVDAGVSAVVANNLIYNPGTSAFHVYGKPGGGPTDVSVVGNVVVAGPDTHDFLRSFDHGVDAGSRIYFHDNSAIGTKAFFAGEGAGRKGRDPVPFVDSPPIWFDWITVLPSASVPAAIARDVGARPTDRDSTDNRLLSELAAGGGAIRDTPADPRLVVPRPLPESGDATDGQ